MAFFEGTGRQFSSFFPSYSLQTKGDSIWSRFFLGGGWNSIWARRSRQGHWTFITEAVVSPPRLTICESSCAIIPSMATFRRVTQTLWLIGVISFSPRPPQLDLHGDRRHGPGRRSLPRECVDPLPRQRPHRHLHRRRLYRPGCGTGATRTGAIHSIGTGIILSIKIIHPCTFLQHIYSMDLYPLC